jgi:formylglycine-generating enzyme required for sulfatase activity
VVGLVSPYNLADIIDAMRPLPPFAEPEMVTIPAGKFIMGSPENPAEGPQHEVKIAKQFEVGKYAVTFDEWDNCVEEGGCK